MAAPGYVVSANEVAARREPGDTVEERITIDASTGCERLEQRVLRVGSGRSHPRSAEGVQEVLYVAAGRGTLRLHGDTHGLEPDTGVFVTDGETYELENAGPDELVLVSVRAPAEELVGERKVTVRYDEQPTLPATAGREFRYLVNQDAGCRDVTQFVGVIPPSRAPLHSHTYDEVVYVVEGEGVLHLGGGRTPISAGSCIHLPPLVEHCLENSGERVMRVVGVFHPSGDAAAARVHEGNNSQVPSSNPPERPPRRQE
jgi:mannose-6-phosphate isomerase-like protein (cupin superfamily)